MPKVMFTDHAELKQGDGQGPKYEKGHVYDLRDDQADRWRRRNLAQDVPGDTPVGLYDPDWRKNARPKARNEPTFDDVGSQDKIESRSFGRGRQSAAPKLVGPAE